MAGEIQKSNANSLSLQEIRDVKVAQSYNANKTNLKCGLCNIRIPVYDSSAKLEKPLRTEPNVWQKITLKIATSRPLLESYHKHPDVWSKFVSHTSDSTRFYNIANNQEYKLEMMDRHSTIKYIPANKKDTPIPVCAMCMSSSILYYELCKSSKFILGN